MSSTILSSASALNSQSEMKRPIHVLDLCQIEGKGGGADRIVFRTAESVNPDHVKTTICAITNSDDTSADLSRRAAETRIDFVALRQTSRFDQQILPRLRQLVHERRIDIVHAHSYKPSWFASRLAKAEGVVPLTTCHGFSGNSFRERFVYYPVERRIIRSFPRIIAVSNRIRETLVRSGCSPERIEVIHNGVNPAEYRRSPTVQSAIRHALGIQTGDVVIGAVGRLGPEKRFDVLLDAFRLLLPSRPSLKLLIAGDGPLWTDLGKRIEKLKAGNQCQLLGYRSDIREVYHAFDLLVQSSDTEGTPTVIVEAMALEVPVVATDVGGTSELLQNERDGLLVPRRNPQALATAIERTLDQRDETSRRVQNARQRVETELSFNSRTEKLCSVYRELLAQGG